MGAACATTHPIECPYNAEAPLSVDGQMAWALFRENAWRIRTAGLGTIIGFELAVPMRRLIAAGTDPDVADDLLARCEAAAVTATNEKDDPDGGEN